MIKPLGTGIGILLSTGIIAMIIGLIKGTESDTLKVFIIYVSAKKNKYCPQITWINKDEE